MKITRFEPEHFSRLYHSLIHYLGKNPYDMKTFCYALYTANQDTYYAASNCRRFQVTCLGSFLNTLDQAPYRPYKTIVQLYCSLEALLESIRCSCLIECDRNCLTVAYNIIQSIEELFYAQYGIDITSNKTIYQSCSHHLVLLEKEADRCLASRGYWDSKKCIIKPLDQ